MAGVLFTGEGVPQQFEVMQDDVGRYAEVAESAEAPKGIFPWHVPGRDGYLGTFPLSADHIAWPVRDHDVDLQIEPEVGVVCRLDYDDEALASYGTDQGRLQELAELPPRGHALADGQR